MKKCLSAVLLLLFTSAAGAEGKHVVELFTSQGCSSCPPADRLLGKLIDSRNDIVALAFHVDYWDDQVHGLSGRWQDPFSDSAHSLRQRIYENRGLAGRNGVYTPQVVVDGRSAAVGSDREAIGKLLQSRPPASADVALDRQSGTMRVTVSGRREGEAEVRLYEFDRRRVTRIGGGENKGKTLTNHHVVRKTRRLGLWAGGRREYLVESLYLNEDEGCAVIVQRRDQGAVLGAASCRP